MEQKDDADKTDNASPGKNVKLRIKSSYDRKLYSVLQSLKVQKYKRRAQLRYSK